MQKRTKQIFIISGATAITLLIAIPAFAATSTTTPAHHYSGMHLGRKRLENAAFGTVSGINGSTITLSYKSKTGTTTSTVATTDATIYKLNGKPGSLSDVTVGERIVAMGTKDSEGNIAAATSVNVLTRHKK